MENNSIVINKGVFYFIASPSLEKAAICYFNKNATSHISCGVVDYKNLSSNFISHFMKQKRLINFAPINLDEQEDSKCFIIAEGLEEEKNIFLIYKYKKELVIDKPFEETPPIPEGVNI